MIKEDLLDKYLNWLKNEFTITKKSKGWFEVTTPFLDRHNDHIQFYFKEIKPNIFQLSDMGDTLIDNGEWNGLLQDEKRVKEYVGIAKCYGVEFNRDTGCLDMETDLLNFPQSKHNFIQCILRLGW